MSHPIDVDVTYCGRTLRVVGTVVAGRPAEGPSFRCAGGYPEEPAYVEDYELFMVRHVGAGVRRERRIKDPRGEIMHDLEPQILDAAADGAEQELEDARQWKYWEARL